MDSKSVTSPSSTDLTIIDSLKSEKNQSSHRLGQSSSRDESDSVQVSMKEVYKSLTVLADKVLAKLNEVLKSDLPDGIASLNPEEHTSEATADRIVAGTTALFDVFARQNSDLTGEELISKFMQTIRGGIKSGYDDAMGTLGDIGALDISGVSEGISKTMELVESKLKAFEDDYRQKNGLTTATAGQSSSSTQASGSSTEQSTAQQQSIAVTA